MDSENQLRAVILSTIVHDIPRKFWEDARTRMKQSYMDMYHQVDADPSVVQVQKLDKLYQDRHFRMEYVLTTLAKDHGFTCSSTLLKENNRAYVYAAKGAIGLTQAYVSSIEAMPKPAKFRERLAELNNIPNTPRFDLGDEPKEIMLGKDFYGLIIHNPAGKRFTEEHQKLGALQFCIPTAECKGWAVQLTMEEILAEYPVTKTDRKPEWKIQPKKQEGGAA